MPENRYACNVSDAAKIHGWLLTRGGIQIWNSIDLADLDKSWTTPILGPDGLPTSKPHWKAADVPVRQITDPSDVDVITSVVVKRFHVGVRMSSTGMALKVTDAGSSRIRKAVEAAREKHGVPAWYEFDYGSEKNACILIEGERLPLVEWARQREVDSAAV